MSDLGEAERSAVLVVDLQNDFLDPEGAYGRGGVDVTTLRPVVAHAVEVVAAARERRVPVVFSQFTLVPGRDGAPLISDHLARLRPFLRAGDFTPGSWGHQTVPELGEPDASVEKVAYSAFAHTRLAWWLDKIGVDHLVVCGIVTNGGVASTVRDAHVRDVGVTLVSDACAAIDPEVHTATLRSLESVATVVDTVSLLNHWEHP